MFFDKLDINNKVTQSNDLVIAQYKLSLNEQKIMLCLISLIQPTDTDFKVYKLKIKDLLDILDIKNKKFYKEVQIITGNLIRR
ncbi:MAG: Initiator Replication protein [Candidatus Electronema aureum]|uniref:Initiator Replication protein n=1 Tax=Candidatus Electronema aureum TaxID=2005002 RepID=A0A521FZF9_9BACT|nr:MAG: Initiator Replication protein [Candidatus Electronema aureum]